MLKGRATLRDTGLDMASYNGGRPSKKYQSSFKEVSEKDYTLLEKACVEAYLSGQSHVIMALSHLTKLADDFPNTTKVKKEGKTVYVKVRANLLLKWLNDKGHSQITAEDIRVAQIRLTCFKERTLVLPSIDW